MPNTPKPQPHRITVEIPQPPLVLTVTVGDAASERRFWAEVAKVCRAPKAPR